MLRGPVNYLDFCTPAFRINWSSELANSSWAHSQTHFYKPECKHTLRHATWYVLILGSRWPGRLVSPQLQLQRVLCGGVCVHALFYYLVEGVCERVCARVIKKRFRREKHRWRRNTLFRTAAPHSCVIVCSNFWILDCFSRIFWLLFDSWWFWLTGNKGESDRGNRILTLERCQGGCGHSKMEIQSLYAFP